MPLNKLTEKVENIEETSEKIEQKVDDLKEEIKDELNENKEFLQKSFGPLDIYKEIIRSNKITNIINAVAIGMLLILVIILTVTLIHNEKEFTAYRENSIDKKEIIEILKDSTYHGE